MRFRRNNNFSGILLRAGLWRSTLCRKIESVVFKLYGCLSPRLDIKASHPEHGVTALSSYKKSKGLLMLTLALCCAVFVLYPVFMKIWIWPTYEYAHERFSGTAIYDAEGLFVGIVPGSMDPLGDYSSGGRLPSDHKALHIDSVPTTFWDVLVSLEDKHIDSWRSWYGVDWVALVKESFKLVVGSGRRGASSLAMQLVRSMRHENVNPDENLAGKIERKLLEIRDAPVLYQQLGGVSGDRFRRWLAMHVPLAAGVPGSGMGGSLYGIEATSRVVFGQASADLNHGQQALLAAAFKKPILLSPSSDTDGLNMRDRRWGELKARAALGLRLAYGSDDKRTRDGLRVLDELGPPVPSVSGELNELLPYAPSDRFRLLSNPERRARRLARGELLEVIGELQQAHGRHWRAKVATVVLTTSLTENVKFKRSFENTLAVLEENLATNLNRPLVPTKEDHANVLLSVADSGGRIVRYYASSLDTSYSGRQRLREQGKYESSRETVSIGSIGKIPAALMFAERGDPYQKYFYCNKSIQGLHNADGSAGVADCTKRGSLFKATEVFGRSLNLPVIQGLKPFPRPEVLNVIRHFRLTYRQDMGSPRVALTLGMVTAAPQRVHAMINQINNRLHGIESGYRLPFLVNKPSTSTNGSHMSSYLDTVSERTYMRNVLRAPLLKKYGGTLSSLEDLSEHKPSRSCRMPGGKTGTVAGHAGITGKWAVGLVDCDSSTFTFVLRISANQPTHPLGNTLPSHRLLAPLIRTTVNSLEAQQ